MQRNSFLISLLVLVAVIAAMSGCVISPRRIVGNGSPTPTPSPTGTPLPGVTGKLYVTDQSANSILRFDNALTATGSATPAATIRGSNTGLNGPQFLKIDTSADRLFVANAGGASVLVFDNISTKNSNVSPTRTITGPANTLVAPSDIALDKTRDLLYVADGTEIVVFSPASTVNSTDPPTRSITIFANNAAQIQSQGIFLDEAADRLYIADPARNAIDVFDNASTLNTAAIANREISGTSTNLAGPTSVALDAFGNLVVANSTNGSITVYASPATANGDMAPIATIVGSATTLLRPGQVVRNPGNTSNEIYVADFNADEVAVFSGVSTSGRNVAPVRQITGTITAQGVALDITR